MAQLQERGNADKSRANASAVYLVGVKFSRQTRNVETFEWEIT